MSSALHCLASRSQKILLWEGQQVHNWGWSIVLKTEEMGKSPCSFWKGAPKHQSSSSPWLVDFEQYFFFNSREEIGNIIWKTLPALRTQCFWKAFWKATWLPVINLPGYKPLLPVAHVFQLAFIFFLIQVEVWAKITQYPKKAFMWKRQKQRGDSNCDPKLTDTGFYFVLQKHLMSDFSIRI